MGFGGRPHDGQAEAGPALFPVRFRALSRRENRPKARSVSSAGYLVRRRTRPRRPSRRRRAPTRTPGSPRGGPRCRAGSPPAGSARPGRPPTTQARRAGRRRPAPGTRAAGSAPPPIRTSRTGRRAYDAGGCPSSRASSSRSSVAGPATGCRRARRAPSRPVQAVGVIEGDLGLGVDAGDRAAQSHSPYRTRSRWRCCASASRDEHVVQRDGGSDPTSSRAGGTGRSRGTPVSVPRRRRGAARRSAAACTR